MNGFYEYLANNLLTILSIVIGSFLAIWIYRKQRVRKRLEYSVNGDYDLISEKIRDSKLQIFYDKKEINNASILTLEIRNTGNVPIKPEDFLKNLVVVFSDGTKIFDANVVDRFPENLEMETSIKRNKFSIKPFLLNSREYFKINFLLTNENGYELEYRIVGISTIHNSDIDVYKSASEFEAMYPWLNISIKLIPIILFAIPLILLAKRTDFEYLGTAMITFFVVSFIWNTIGAPYVIGKIRSLIRP